MTLLPTRRSFFEPELRHSQEEVLVRGLLELQECIGLHLKSQVLVPKMLIHSLVVGQAHLHLEVVQVVLLEMLARKGQVQVPKMLHYLAVGQAPLAVEQVLARKGQVQVQKVLQQYLAVVQVLSFEMLARKDQVPKMLQQSLVVEQVLLEVVQVLLHQMLARKGQVKVPKVL